jgi:uncharacterized oxidoreductase
MKLQKRTVLITGGTSGIGRELARQLLERGNTVIVTGRDPEALEAAKRLLPGLHTFRSDVSDPAAIVALQESILAQFPAMDTLINNAGIMRKLNLNRTRDLLDVTREIDINLSGPVRMIQQFLPHLKLQERCPDRQHFVRLGLCPHVHIAGLQRYEVRNSLIHSVVARAAQGHGRYGDRTGPAPC